MAGLLSVCTDTQSYWFSAVNTAFLGSNHSLKRQTGVLGEHICKQSFPTVSYHSRKGGSWLHTQ